MISGVSPRALAALVLVVLLIADILASWVGPGFDIAVGFGLILVLGLISVGCGLTWADLGLARSSWESGLRWGAVCGGLVLAGYAVALSVPGLRSMVSGAAESAPGALLSAVVLIPLGTVVHEEFAFRGVLLALLRRARGRRFAVLASSALFGLWHIVPALSGGAGNAVVGEMAGSGGLGTVLQLVGTVLITGLGGVLLCELRLRSDSLLAPILVHWAVNAGGVLFVLLA
jgi:membrane protease YdiL (CAAX protease family)